MWDLIRDVIILAAGIIISIIQSLQGKTRKSKAIWWSVALILVVLGVTQIISNDNQKKNDKIVMDGLSKTVKSLLEQKRVDSLAKISENEKDSIFQSRLFNEFKISRDSINNKPVRNIYNTHIQKAENVKIGQ